MSNPLTRRTDPLDDFFRGFFVRPVDFGGQQLATSPAAPALFKVPHAHAAPLATMHRRCGRAY